MLDAGYKKRSIKHSSNGILPYSLCRCKIDVDIDTRKYLTAPNRNDMLYVNETFIYGIGE